MKLAEALSLRASMRVRLGRYIQLLSNNAYDQGTEEESKKQLEAYLSLQANTNFVNLMSQITSTRDGILSAQQALITLQRDCVNKFDLLPGGWMYTLLGADRSVCYSE